MGRDCRLIISTVSKNRLCSGTTHYKNPSWKGLELIPQDKLTQEEQNQHMKYCEVRFGVADFDECQKKFSKNEFPQMEHSSD